MLQDVSFYPVSAAFLHLSSLRWNVLRTSGVGEDAGDILAGLVEADLAVSAHDPVPHQAHVEASRGFVQACSHSLAFDWFVLVVILRTNIELLIHLFMGVSGKI